MKAFAIAANAAFTASSSPGSRSTDGVTLLPGALSDSLLDSPLDARKLDLSFMAALVAE